MCAATHSYVWHDHLQHPQQLMREFSHTHTLKILLCYSRHVYIAHTHTHTYDCVMSQIYATHMRMGSALAYLHMFAAIVCMKVELFVRNWTMVAPPSLTPCYHPTPKSFSTHAMSIKSYLFHTMSTSTEVTSVFDSCSSIFDPLLSSIACTLSLSS